MDDDLYVIGEVARRTGLPVRTIRFYADEGIVPPAAHSRAGYRLFDLDALNRLDLVRTLRDLGLPLATIRGVLEQEASCPRWPPRTRTPSTSNCTRFDCAEPFSAQLPNTIPHPRRSP